MDSFRVLPCCNDSVFQGVLAGLGAGGVQQVDKADLDKYIALSLPKFRV